jgi:hypothetical protein
MSWLGVIEDHHHAPDATRIAFAVESREEVDRLAEIVRAVRAVNVEGPEDVMKKGRYDERTKARKARVRSLCRCES